MNDIKAEWLGIKTTEVLGTIFTLPMGAKYIAVDKDGEVGWYIEKPETSDNSFWVSNHGYGFLGYIKMKNNCNWEEMVWEITDET